MTLLQINNITALPITYFYSIGGIQITNPSEFYVPNTSTTIDVYVVDGTNCISNTVSITILKSNSKYNIGCTKLYYSRHFWF